MHPSAWGTAPPELPGSSSDGPQPDISPPGSSSAEIQRAADYLRARGIINNNSSNTPTPTQPGAPAPQPGFGYFPHTLAPAPMLEPPPNPLTYVLYRHNNALLALMQEPLVLDTDPTEMMLYRALAVETVNRFGWSWPAILDADFPAASNEAAGAKYERGSIRWIILLHFERCKR